jgi:hypothetical protein
MTRLALAVAAVGVFLAGAIAVKEAPRAIAYIIDRAVESELVPWTWAKPVFYIRDEVVLQAYMKHKKQCYAQFGLDDCENYNDALLKRIINASKGT